MRYFWFGAFGGLAIGAVLAYLFGYFVTGRL